ncbi:DUF4870 domain-containing protein [Candidatus Woesearchaeota archaeon]|jgi:uncharacterized membrane protein|nr:DUF4870 domain-containing protein [Candidatus Woesearchaeota archaeon]
MAEITGEQKLFGILAYLGILVIIPLLVKKDDKWVLEHAKQGLGFLIMGVVVWVASMILAFIPILGWLVIVAAQIALFIIWIMAVIKVLSGQPFVVPIIGKTAAKWKF